MPQIKKFDQVDKAKTRRKEKQEELEQSRRQTYESIKKQALLEVQFYHLGQVFFFLMCLVIFALAVYTGLQVFAK